MGSYFNRSEFITLLKSQKIIKSDFIFPEHLITVGNKLEYLTITKFNEQHIQKEPRR